MGTRRKARELALQALFYMEVNPNGFEEKLDLYCRDFAPSKEIRPFFETLVRGVNTDRERIDEIIERYSANWKIRRMSGVDRNVLRMAVYELIFCEDIPYKVSINEAIDVGKKFGTEESGGFINGILDSIRLALEKNEIQPREGGAVAAPD